MLLLSWGAAAKAAPRVIVDNPVYDFGQAADGGWIRHDFVIRNGGDSLLSLTGVVSSCPVCLEASAERMSVPAGGRTLIHAVLDLRLLKGPVIRLIEIDSDDPRQPTLYLEVTGTVLPAYESDPPFLEIDLSQERYAVAAGIRMLRPLRAPLCRVEGGRGRLSAAVAPDGPGRFLLTAIPVGVFPEGDTVYDLTVRSPDLLDPPFRISCLVHNPPALELIPRILRFAPVAGSQTRTLWVCQHGPAPFLLLDVLPPSDRFQVEVIPDPGGTDYRIEVTAWGLDATLLRSGSLALRMRDRQGKEISIPSPFLIGRERDRGNP
jgi:Protein of unknown function (DUF1573)